MQTYFNGMVGALALCLSTTAVAQTVTVAPSGATFTSVKAAVDSFSTGGTNNGNPEDNVINITQGGLYLEDVGVAPDPVTSGVLNLTQNENYTIRCTDPTLSATIVATSASAGGGTALIGTNVMNGKTLTLENLVLLPTYNPGDGIVPTTQSGEAIRMGNGAAVQGNLVARNILISANNGSNAPASNGSAAATGHYTRFGGSGFRLLGGVRNMLLENVIATHCTNGVWDNGDIVDPLTDSRTIGSGCKFTYNTTTGYNLGAAGLSGINGTAEAPVIIANNNGFGLFINASPNPIYGDINYLHVINNKAANDATNASGVQIVGTSFPNNSRFFKSIFAGNGSGTDQYGNVSANNSQNTTVKFEQCTFFDAANDQPTLTVVNNLGATANTNFVLLDCIVAGAGDYILFLEESASLTITYSATVTAGPHSLDTARAGLTDTANAIQGPAAGPGVTVANVIHADPQFSSTDSTNPNYLVVTNTAYATASSTSGPLAGGSSYAPPGASVSDWSIYN